MGSLEGKDERERRRGEDGKERRKERGEEGRERERGGDGEINCDSLEKARHYMYIVLTQLMSIDKSTSCEGREGGEEGMFTSGLRLF